MARIRSGGLAGQISGSVAGVTYSHNRYGAYVRTRAIPVNPQTLYQQNIRAILASVSANWRDLGAALQEQWKTWAAANPVTDPFGDKQILSGQAAYVKLNSRIIQAGDTEITSPPVISPPAALTTMTAEFDIGAGILGVNYTPTPVGAGLRVWVWLAVTNSPGVSYFKNLYKLAQITAVNQASPVGLDTPWANRFGTPIVGQRASVLVATETAANGQLSIPRRYDGTVVST